jgi:serine/threonine protein kinase
LKCSTHEEVRALRELAQCQNIMKLEEHFTSPGVNEVWARLEYMEGGNLRSFLRGLRPRKAPEDAARFVLAQVLAGLAEMHRLGWMHRDIKAENIGFTKPSISRNGHLECSVKLLDFDTAVPIPGSGGKLQEIIGTVENMAPEVYEGSYDEKADLWSFGVVAFEVLFGFRPFNDASIDHVQEMIRNWSKYLVIPYDASDETSSFLSVLLANPKDRFSSAQASRHTWLDSAYDPACISLAAAELSDVLERETEPLVSGAMLSARMPSKRNSSPHEGALERRSSLPVPLLHQDVEKLAPRRASAFASSSLAAEDEVASLSRIRRSLSDWNAPVLGRVYGLADASVSRNPMVVPRCEVPGHCAETSSYVGPNYEGDAKENQGGPDYVAEDHSNYLQRIRSRNAEVMRVAGELAAPKARPSSSKARVAPSAPMEQGDTAPQASSTETSACAAHLALSTSQLRKRVEASQLRVNTESEAWAGESPTGGHLRGAKQRVRDLLSRFATAVDSEATSTPSQAPSEPLNATSPVAVRAAGSPASIQPESEPTPTSKDPTELPVSSPEAWLEQHRRRTQTLLGRLRLASEVVETGRPASHQGQAVTQQDEHASSRVWV